MTSPVRTLTCCLNRIAHGNVEIGGNALSHGLQGGTHLLSVPTSALADSHWLDCLPTPACESLLLAALDSWAKGKAWQTNGQCMTHLGTNHSGTGGRADTAVHAGSTQAMHTVPCQQPRSNGNNMQVRCYNNPVGH